MQLQGDHQEDLVFDVEQVAKKVGPVPVTTSISVHIYPYSSNIDTQVRP